jgi:hypothetical protein
VGLQEELEEIARKAAEHAEDGEAVAAVIPAKSEGARVYLVAYAEGDGAEPSGWLLLDDEGRLVDDRLAVRDAVSLVALCEVAEDSAGGGELDELRSRLVGLRLTENPAGLDDAVAAVDELERAIGTPPRVASLEYLEQVGTAVRNLEASLGDGPGSPFAAAMKSAAGAIEQLTTDVEANYKVPLT